MPMIIDEIDVSDLPTNVEESFIAFEKRLREALEDAQRRDQSDWVDQDGHYVGSFLPERYYVSSILAFLDETRLELDVVDISQVADSDFKSQFSQFFNRINYAKTRFLLRKQQSASGASGTPLTFEPKYREEIYKLLGTIRKIVNQEVDDEAKKEKIFNKIASLQSEIDHKKTTVDNLFGRMIDLSQTIGECAENVEPLIDKLERIKKIFWDRSQKMDLLSKSDRPKLLPSDNEEALSDEIPF